MSGRAGTEVNLCLASATSNGCLLGRPQVSTVEDASGQGKYVPMGARGRAA